MSSGNLSHVNDACDRIADSKTRVAGESPPTSLRRGNSGPPQVSLRRFHSVSVIAILL